MKRYYSLSAHTRRRYGQRVQKIPLDAGFSCPNRDGTLSRAGCLFCNPKGSGSGFGAQGQSLAEQWEFWRSIHVERHHLSLFTAYLQSYSNTHGPIEKLAETLTRLKGLPGLESLSLGTRPDCLDKAKLELLARQRDELGLSDVTLELGLQSASDTTLAYINRGHTAAEFAEAVKEAAAHGLTVVGHVIAGLPTPNGREGEAELLDSIDFINTLPVSGIKFHNLYVCRGTGVAKLYEAGQYVPLSQDEYLTMLSAALMRLKPTTVVHRLNGNPGKGELLAPDWAANMRGLHNAVRSHFEKHDVWQGKHNGAGDAIPPWFDPEYRGVIE
ncbi:TIGR01212 family radical SAM protein [Pseudodesulfovibrio cashew]|uniref:TIGR01212 family radical SAM protein n=1 Tax=Pseudodesulfovibrio cashew TaxID=2678688 RepID=A0A6I6JI39_9BACT|nr:TIGR01212 family radical SAM protein [Pseudodesulfovibrio cashew]QGY39817.1 TIGR01212 family radical SAM protein [Pseudodesulfovibrio cashew]